MSARRSGEREREGWGELRKRGGGGWRGKGWIKIERVERRK